MHHCFKTVGGQTVLSLSEKGEGQALEVLILILLPFVCRGKGDQPSFTHLLYGSTTSVITRLFVSLHVCSEKSPQSGRQAQSSTFRYKTSSVMKSWRLMLASATENIILLVLLTFQNEVLRHFTPKGVNR